MDALDTVLIAMVAGAIRVSTPFLFVSLGECLTETGGRINLGNEGALVLGAMAAYACAYQTGNPWLGVLGGAGALGSSLQTVGVTWGYHLFYAAPYVVTLLILVATVRPGRALRGMPGELSIAR